jgi:hypothetical protein
LQELDTYVKFKIKSLSYIDMCLHLIIYIKN